MQTEKTAIEQIFDIYKEADGEAVLTQQLKEIIKKKKIDIEEHSIQNAITRLIAKGLIEKAGENRYSGNRWVKGAEYFDGRGKRSSNGERPSAAPSSDPSARLIKQLNFYVNGMINVVAELPNYLLSEKERDELNQLRDFKRRHDEVADLGRKIKTRPSSAHS